MPSISAPATGCGSESRSTASRTIQAATAKSVSPFTNATSTESRSKP